MLFILKKHNYWPSFGLVNSCQFVAGALASQGVYTKVVEVVDNNDIDREVTAFNPSLVVVEALWVVPEKFPVLLRLHPDVKWVVRVHSNLPFISGEGMSVEWLKRYVGIGLRDDRLVVAANSRKFVDDAYRALNWPVELLPNIYFPTLVDIPVPDRPKCCGDDDDDGDGDRRIDIGCFGAIRPLKNNLEQAVAALAFANEQRVRLRFHINSTRVEQNADPVLRNLEALFGDRCHHRHELVKHEWMPHGDFIRVIQSMDYGMQVSFSETFNIVAADFVHNNVPFVGSKEIEWLPERSQADTTDIASIIAALRNSTKWHTAQRSKAALKDFSQKSLRRWMEFLCK